MSLKLLGERCGEIKLLFFVLESGNLLHTEPNCKHFYRKGPLSVLNCLTKLISTCQSGYLTLLFTSLMFLDSSNIKLQKPKTSPTKTRTTK